MPPDVKAAGVLDTISVLAEDIARASPDCADKAMRITDLVQSLETRPDREAIQEAIESKLLDSEMSESQIQSTTSAAVGAVRART